MESNKRIMYAIQLNNLHFSKEWKVDFWSRFSILYPDWTKGTGFRTKNIDLTDKEIISAGPISQYLKNKIMVVLIHAIDHAPIHADGVGSDVAIQIPFIGCNDQTQTNFYEYEDGKDLEMVFHPKIGAREILHKEKLKRVQTYSMLDKPVLFRSGWAHDVTSTYQEKRIIYSWRFKEKYSWEEAKEICEKYYD